MSTGRKFACNRLPFHLVKPRTLVAGDKITVQDLEGNTYEIRMLKNGCIRVKTTKKEAVKP